MPVRIVLCDGCSFTRSGLRAAFDAASDVVVVGEAADAADAVNVVRASEPDVVLVDADLPPTGGFAIVGDMVQAFGPGHPRVIVLASKGSVDDVLAALRQGAKAFLPKELAPADLSRSIHVVAAGGAVVSALLLHDLLAQVVHHVPDPAWWSSTGILRLSPREREVLMLIADGASNPEIAEQLVVTEGTVKCHVSHVMSKLGCRDRAHAVALAYRSGLIVAPPSQPAAGRDG